MLDVVAASLKEPRRVDRDRKAWTLTQVQSWYPTKYTSMTTRDVMNHWDTMSSYSITLPESIMFRQVIDQPKKVAHCRGNATSSCTDVSRAVDDKQQSQDVLKATSPNNAAKRSKTGSASQQGQDSAEQDTSPEEAAKMELEEFNKALANSRADARSADKVKLMRLKGYKQDVMQHLAASSHLEAALQEVLAAGCEPLPEWANGALLLVPLTPELVAEVDDWSLQPYHIVLRDPQVGSVCEALRQIPRDQGRPKLDSETKPAGAEYPDAAGDVFTDNPTSASSSAASRSTLRHDDLEFGIEMRQRLHEVGLTVEHTFLRHWSAVESESNHTAHTL